MGHRKGRERRAAIDYSGQMLEKYREAKDGIMKKLNDDLECVRDVQKFAAVRKIVTPKGDFERNIANNEKWLLEWISLYDQYEKLLEKNQIKDAVNLAKRMQDLRNWLQVNTTWLDGYVTAVCAAEGKHPSEFFKWWDAPATEDAKDAKATEDLLYHMETDNCPYNKGPCCPENCQYEKGMEECPVHCGQQQGDEEIEGGN